MESAILTVIALLALAVRRFPFARLQRRSWFGGIGAAHDNTLDRRRPIFEQPYVGVITGNGWNPGSYRMDQIEAESRAETYLGRIVALVGAAKKGNSYVLDVGTTRFRFRVRDRYVRRLRDASDPKCAYEETCFYSGFQGMPKTEQIAAALLQLRNNPALFDRWALQRGLAFKADGQVFARVR